MRAVCASLLCAVCLLFGSTAANAAVAVGSAGGFVDSVGVDTHLTFADTSYGDWSRLVGLLGVLGVRHLADGAYGNPAGSWAGFNQLFDSRVQLATAAGLRFTFEMGKPGYQGGSIAQLVSVMSGPLRSSVEAVADPNEFDTSSGLTDWRSPLVSYDRQLYAAVKASPALRSVPVIGPSLVGDGAPGALGDQQAFLDAGAIHPYTGAKSPTVAYTQAQLQRISRVSGDKPVWATEVGYSTALGAPAGQQPVSEYTHAVYLLRELLGNFAAGIKRTFAYELIDDFPDPSGANLQDHFGLLRADYSPKPAFTALGNLLALIGRQSPRSLSPLAVSVSHAPSDLQKVVLQQGPGSYVIALWRQASVWNPDTRQPIRVPATPVTLTLPASAHAATADPIATRTLTPQTITNHQLHIQLGPNPLLIHITTGGSSQAVPQLASGRVSGTATPRSGVASRTAAERPATRLVRCVSASVAVRSLGPTLRWLGGSVRRLTCGTRVRRLQIIASVRSIGHARLTAIAHHALDPHRLLAAARWLLAQSRRASHVRQVLIARIVIAH